MSTDTVRVLHDDVTAELAGAFGTCRRIAWDVETSGLDWRRDRLGTCQVYAQEIGAVLVSVGADRPARLVALLENPAVEKVFHHAPFDLRFMVHAWSARPTAVRCTKVASKLLAPSASNDTHSLQQLALRYLGVNLAKGQVRTSDWATSDLTQAQIEYAVGDVLHLPALMDAMGLELKEAGLAELYDSCCTFLPSRVALEIGSYPDVFAY